MENMVNFYQLENTYKGKKVFLTGHTGFKGSWLAFLLNELGANVMGFALPLPTAVNHFDLLGLDKKIKHIEGGYS